MTSIAETLAKAESILSASGVTESRREAISLLTLATKKDRTFFYAHPDHPVTSDEGALLDSFLQRRASREPLQYIAGLQEFFGLEFEVTPDVLIPRPETEMVVEHAIEILRTEDHGRFCEVGVGSGCIAISVLHHRPNSSAVGLDVSGAALEVARRNAEKHNVMDKLDLIESDVFGAVAGERFDMIVSNPPYVPVRDIDGLQAEVRDFEPRSALTDGSNGLSIIRTIAAEAPKFLLPGGAVLMEIGFNQADEVVKMFELPSWQKTELFPDLQGIPRLVHARLK